jgi:hypothetical protein
VSATGTAFRIWRYQLQSDRGNFVFRRSTYLNGNDDTVRLIGPRCNRLHGTPAIRGCRFVGPIPRRRRCRRTTLHAILKRDGGGQASGGPEVGRRCGPNKCLGNICPRVRSGNRHERSARMAAAIAATALTTLTRPVTLIHQPSIAAFQFSHASTSARQGSGYMSSGTFDPGAAPV